MVKKGIKIRKNIMKTIESLGRMTENTEVRKFIRPNEAVKIYGICRQYLENIAAEAGAPYKIGSGSDQRECV